MKIGLLPASTLFQGMGENELEELLDCLSATAKVFRDGEYIFRSGTTVTTAGLVLAGAVSIVKNDVWGNRKIIGRFGPGQLIGETYACLKNEPLTINVEAQGDTKILFLDIAKIIVQCPKSCSFHNRFVRNLLFVFARQNLMLTQKMDLITPRSIRDRMLTYLSAESIRQGTYTFEIPFNRQQLADYLSVDRSALSAELSRMQKDGLVCVRKNRFQLLAPSRQETPKNQIKETNKQ